jgi:hypothetical protein
MTRSTGRLTALILTGLVVVACARLSAVPTSPPVATPAGNPPASAPAAAGPTASPAPSLRPLPSFDLGDLTAVDKALAGASDAISAAQDPGSEGGSR